MEFKRTMEKLTSEQRMQRAINLLKEAMDGHEQLSPEEFGVKLDALVGGDDLDQLKENLISFGLLAAAVEGIAKCIAARCLLQIKDDVMAEAQRGDLTLLEQALREQRPTQPNAVLQS